MNIGIHADGRLFIGQLEDSAGRIDLNTDLHLELRAHPSAAGYTGRFTLPTRGVSLPIWIAWFRPNHLRRFGSGLQFGDCRDYTRIRCAHRRF